MVGQLEDAEIREQGDEKKKHDPGHDKKGWAENILLVRQRILDLRRYLSQLKKTEEDDNG